MKVDVRLRAPDIAIARRSNPSSRFRPNRFPVTAAIAAAVLSGAVAVASPLGALACVGAVITFAGSRLPPLLVVGIALALRNFTDPLAAASAGSSGLNASAALGLFVIGVTALRLLESKLSQPPRLIIGLGIAYGIWVLVGFSNYGLDASVVREAVRVTSILAVFALACDARRDGAQPATMMGIVVAAGVLPAVTAIATGGSFGSEATARSASTFSHPNAAADLFATDLTVAVALALGPYRHLRSWAVAAIALLSVALLASGSLGGLAQGIAAALYLVATGPYDSSAKVKTFGATLAVVAVFIASPLGTDRLEELKSTTAPSQATAGIISNSADWRIFNWSQFLDYWREKPLLGWGAGTTDDLINPLGAPPHNDYVRLLVETGLIGVVCFGGLIAFLIGSAYVRTRAPSRTIAFANHALLATLVGVAVNAIAGTPTLRTTTMLAVAVLLAASLAAHDGLDDKRESTRETALTPR